MAVRSREEAIALRNEVLDLWAAGRLAGEIVEAVGIKRGYADVILCKARAAGDPRAAWRLSSNGGAFIVPLAREAPATPARPSVAKLRSGRPSASDIAFLARREAVLDAWAAGMAGPEIGRSLGIRWKTASMIVHRAREWGEPRAKRRHRGPANGIPPSVRRGLERAARRYGVTVTLPGEHP